MKAMRGFLIALLMALVLPRCGCNEASITGDVDAESTSADSDLDLTSEAVDVPDTADPPIEDTEVESVPECGNGVRDPGEECDDHNTNDCDGCSLECLIEMALLSGGSFAGAEIPAAPGEAGGPCLLDDFTIELWFRVDMFPSEMSDNRQYLMWQTEGYGLGIHHWMDGVDWAFWFVQMEEAHSGLVEIEIPGGLVPGTWHHLALTRDMPIDSSPWKLDLFFDGTLLDSRSEIPSTYAGYCGGPLFLGGTSTAEGEESFSGAIDEARISNEILYTTDFTPQSRLAPLASTVAFWDFDTTSTGTVWDRSGNDFHASTVGGIPIPDECHLP